MAPSFGMSSCFFSPTKQLLRKKHLPHRKTQKPPYLHSVILKNEAKIKKMHVFLHFSSEKFCQFKKKQYLCTRFRKGSTNNPGAVVQLVRISACHAGGRGFESRPHRKASSFGSRLFACVASDSNPPSGAPKNLAKSRSFGYGFFVYFSLVADSICVKCPHPSGCVPSFPIGALENLRFLGKGGAARH